MRVCRKDEEEGGDWGWAGGLCLVVRWRARPSAATGQRLLGPALSRRVCVISRRVQTLCRTRSNLCHHHQPIKKRKEASTSKRNEQGLLVLRFAFVSPGLVLFASFFLFISSLGLVLSFTYALIPHPNHNRPPRARRRLASFHVLLGLLSPQTPWISTRDRQTHPPTHPPLACLLGLHA